MNQPDIPTQTANGADPKIAMPQPAPPAQPLAVRKPQARIGSPIMPLVPTTIDECWRLATCFSKSGVYPKSYPGERGSEENAAAIFGAIQLGATVGIPPVAAISTIMIVNGRFALYGDGQLSVVENSGLLEEFDEYWEGEWPSDPKAEVPSTFKAVCIVKRAGRKQKKVEFSVGDAMRARLWGKTGKFGDPTPWVTMPKRMLQLRARAFALRDTFSDVLLGLQHSGEELADGLVIDGTADVVETRATPQQQLFGQTAARQEEATFMVDEAETGAGAAQPEPSNETVARDEQHHAVLEPYVLTDDVGEVQEIATAAEFQKEFLRWVSQPFMQNVAKLTTIAENNQVMMARLKEEAPELHEVAITTWTDALSRAREAAAPKPAGYMLTIENGGKFALATAQEFHDAFCARMKQADSKATVDALCEHNGAEMDRLRKEDPALGESLNGCLRLEMRRILAPKPKAPAENAPATAAPAAEKAAAPASPPPPPAAATSSSVPRPKAKTMTSKEWTTWFVSIVPNARTKAELDALEQKHHASLGKLSQTEPHYYQKCQAALAEHRKKIGG